MFFMFWHKFERKIDKNILNLSSRHKSDSIMDHHSIVLQDYPIHHVVFLWKHRDALSTLLIFYNGAFYENSYQLKTIKFIS